MKKIISIALSLVLFAGIADAQISIKKSSVDTPKQMTTLTMSWSWIYQINDTYFIVMKSDNQFDDNFWLQIGETKEECLESLSSLLELADTIGETERFEIDNGMREKYVATHYRAMGTNGLNFTGQGHAGTGYINTNNLNKAVKWIEKNVE